MVSSELYSFADSYLPITRQGGINAVQWILDAICTGITNTTSITHSAHMLIVFESLPEFSDKRKKRNNAFMKYDSFLCLKFRNPCYSADFDCAALVSGTVVLSGDPILDLIKLCG